MNDEQQQYETCRRHNRDYHASLTCDGCERERKAGAVAAYAARRRWDAQANGMPPPADNYPTLGYDDYDDDEYHPRRMMMPVPMPPDVRRWLAACLFVAALFAGWFIGFRLNLWGMPV